jgi:hypothetical protein
LWGASGATGPTGPLGPTGPTGLQGEFSAAQTVTTINFFATTTFTTSSAYRGRLLMLAPTEPSTVVLHDEFQAGYHIDFVNMTPYPVEITINSASLANPAPGFVATLGPFLRDQYSTCSAISLGSYQWLLTGDLVP